MDPNNSSETTNADASIPMHSLENFFTNFTQHQTQLFENLSHTLGTAIKESMQAPPNVPPIDVTEEDNIVPDQNTMDKAVSDLIGTHSETESEHQDEEDNSLDDVLNNELLNSNEDVAASVSPQMATTVNKIWELQSNDNIKKQVLEKYKRPQNCESFLVLKCNPEIWNNTISSTARSQDIKVQKTASNIIGAASAITVAADNLLNLKGNRDMSSKDLRHYLGSVVKTLMDSVILLSMANQDINQVRRDNLKIHLDNSYKCLANNERTNAKLLFGDNIADRINNIATNNRAMQKNWQS